MENHEISTNSLAFRLHLSYAADAGNSSKPKISGLSAEKGQIQFPIHNGNPVTEHLESNDVCAVLLSTILAAEPMAADNL